MMLKRSTTESKPSAVARLVRAGVASLAAVGAVAALATGCLDRNLCTTACEPKTSNVFVDQIVQTAVDKIDLLFMVDNSTSMADKQEILRDAVPVLVSRLISPICLDGTGKPTGESATGGTCIKGGSPEFNPIGDIHIGIVSSSLGAHGGTVCSTGAATDTLDDKGELIGARRPAPGGMANPTAALNFDVKRTWNSQGFLAWDPSGTRNGTVPGIKDPTVLNSAFQDMIVADGEHGCGYEASLEAWYRFLIDPEPPAAVGLDKAGANTVRGSALILDPKTNKPVLDANGFPTCTGCDTTLLAQRRAFLRPDSLVAIVMMSDENDCSIRDDGVGWFVGASARMPKSTAACDLNPNDPCCRSCAQKEDKGPPAGCSALSADATCKGVPAGQQYVTWDALHDALNMRCYNQHKRFGFDLLYETGRYVNGLTKTTLPLQSNGNVSVTNPLYDTTGTDKAPRAQSLVFLAGIVGVPWQDIADDASLTGAGLNYLTAQELVAKDRWSALLGTPQGAMPGGPPIPPSDPFMVESIDPRSGTNTIAMPAVATAPVTSTNPQASVINGHEYNHPQLDDLQFACTFKLKTSKTCANGDIACDCAPDKAGSTAALTAANSPLCQGGAGITTQVYAKAYPGARELQVLKDLGDNAIVASICPKVVNSPNPGSDPNYGYNPAVGAIIERLKEALKGKCLPRPIETNPQGQVLCKVIEAQKSGCDCVNTPGRAPADATIIKAVQAQLKATGNCGGDGQDPCTTWCECEILQESNANGKTDLTTCQNNDTNLKTPGYCYIDAKAETVPGANATAIQTALSKCPSNQQQLLHFVDADSSHKTPATGAVAFIACLGAPIVAVSTGAGGGN